jgi:hypothetical protein
MAEVEREMETDNLLLDRQLAELKKCSDAFIAYCQQLGTGIDVMQASIHLLKDDGASNWRRSRRANVKLHPASPQRSPGHIRSPGVRTNRESADSRDVQTLAAPTIDREIGDFLQSLESLQVAMENRATWLADEISAQEGVVCSICLEKWPEDDLIQVDNCKHEFCLDCFRAYIISKIQEQQYPILCPTCVADRVEGGEPQSIAVQYFRSTSTDPRASIGISLDLAKSSGLPRQHIVRFRDLTIRATYVLLECRRSGHQSHPIHFVGHF